MLVLLYIRASLAISLLLLVLDHLHRSFTLASQLCECTHLSTLCVAVDSSFILNLSTFSWTYILVLKLGETVLVLL